ncbi:hypothetical protein RND81_14G176700 [Saponaria officinalis]|uniref:Small-subunit processome Utp12 domain-containing protein n=1 Tax=Saponaria officinalis TaxID=3572 RepID=A0AAW1GR44_SAPOF
MGRQNLGIESSADMGSKKKSKKKRRVPETDTLPSESLVLDKREEADAVPFDVNEPTIADKLASLDSVKIGDADIQEMQESPKSMPPPSADSVHVLLKQALHADDRPLLLECLGNQDSKVITNSVSQLSAADIFKLLDSLISIIQLRGAVLVCALPWLRSLLLQHSSVIISQDSSLKALNSLYHIIDSRVSTYTSAQKLAASLDLSFAAVDDAVVDEYDSVAPVIYEDDDESEKEEESEEDAMETDHDTKEPEDFSGISDAGLSDEDLSD